MVPSGWRDPTKSVAKTLVRSSKKSCQEVGAIDQSGAKTLVRSSKKWCQEVGPIDQKCPPKPVAEQASAAVELRWET